MQTDKLKKFPRIMPTSIAAIASLLFCMSVSANNKTGAVFQPRPFPTELKRYETQIFNLFDQSSVDSRTHERHYDAEFVKQFNAALKPYLKLDPKLERKLFSGPGAEGAYIEIDGTCYLFYTICQAHACNTTNLAILYQPDAKKLTGRLQYKCDLYPLNSPQPVEVTAIEALSPINTKDSFYQESCEYEKQGAK